MYKYMKQTNKGFIGAIALGLIAVFVTVGSFIAYRNLHNQPALTAGAFNPTGGQTYRLQSSISSTQTTITLTSFKEPISNIKYTMSYLNSTIEYATIDPQNNNSKEFVSFTGITQNSDNTATLTGVSRGLGFSYPYTASSTLASSHSGQSIFILSNPPQLTNNYANKSNDDAITGIWNFNSYLPTSNIIATTSNQFVTKQYVDGGLLAGAATSTESVTGISRLATRLQQASSTLSTVNTPLVLQAQYATSSFNGSNTTGLNVVVTRNNNTIDPNAIATSSSDTYNWGGNNSYTGTSLFTGIPTFNAGAIFNVTPTFGTFNATSSLVTSTSTISGNLNVLLNASTTNLTVSNSCNGCGMAYTASSTAYSVSSGATTYASNIPLSANNGVGTFNLVVNSSHRQGTFFISRTGLTTATIEYTLDSGTSDGAYTLAWSGTSLVVTETTDTNSNASITGTVYWYK